MKPVITKQVEDGVAFFTVRWSPLRKAEKYDIVRHVPSMAGFFELYYMDTNKTLHLFYVSRVWIGGLRSRLRKLTDPDLEDDPKRKHILETRDCYYRYSLSESFMDLTDVFFFFSETYYPHTSTAEDSGRYDEIYVKEVSSEKLITI
jgi:hypothetical protein